MDPHRSFHYNLHNIHSHQPLHHPHHPHHHYSQRPGSSYSDSVDGSYDSRSRFRWIISLGLLLPALAAVIGVVAWAVSAEVVIGARREAALKASDSLRFPQGLHRHREDEEIENDQKTLRISSIWEKEDDSHNTPSHNTGHDPDDDNDEDANGQHDPNVRVKTITSSTSPPTSSSSSSTTAKPVVVPILSLSTTASPTTHSPTLPPLTVRSSATRPSATHIQKLSKKENDRNDNRETMKNSTADISVLNGVSNGFGMPSFDPITEKPKKTPGDQVAEVINRLVAQRRNPNGVRPHIVVVAPLHDPNRKSKTTARPSSAASKTTRTSSGKSTTTTKTTIRTTVKPKSNRKSGSTTRHPKTTTKKVVERTTEAIMTTSEFPTAIPILSKDAETLLAAAHVLAAKHKMMRNDEEEDVQHKEASEASQQFQKFEAVIDVPQEPHYINRQPYPVYQFEPITQSPSYQNVPSSSPPVSISSYHGPQEYHRSSYHHPTNHHAKKQHSSSRMGPAPSPSPAASHNMPIHVHPTQIIPTSLPTPLPSGPPPIIPQLYIQNENPRHQPPQFGAPQLHPPQMNQQPVHHFHTVHHPYPQQPHPQGGQQVPQTFMVNPYGLNGPVPPGQLLQMQSQIQQQLQQMQLQPNAPRPMMGPQLFNGHNQPNINNQINLNHNNQQQQQQQSQQNQGQYTASGSDVNPYMSRPNEEESDDSESVVSNTGITMNGNQGDGSSPTGMISVSSNEPAPSYQQQVAQESSPSKGLTLHFGGGPVGGGGQLVTSPVGIFKTLLLPLLPKPRVNLNGKVVFGVVLEKGVGFGKQKPSMVSFRPSHLYRLGRQ